MLRVLCIIAGVIMVILGIGIHIPWVWIVGIILIVIGLLGIAVLGDADDILDFFD